MPYTTVHVVDRWMRRMNAARAAIAEKNGGADPPTLAACHAVDPAAFTALIEAAVALAPLTGLTLAPDLIALAGLHPVDSAAGLRGLPADAVRAALEGAFGVTDTVAAETTGGGR